MAKRGPKSWTAKQLEAVRVYYVSVRGHVSKTAKKFITSAKTVRTLAAAGNWDADIPRVDAQTREISNRTVAESHAVTLSAIDKYIDIQHDYIEDRRIKTSIGAIDGFNPDGVEKLVKTRELLTGGDTERIGVGRLLDEFDKLDDNGKRAFIADLRSRATQRSG